MKAGFEAPASAALARASAAQGNGLLTQRRAQCDVLIKGLVALTGLAETPLRSRLATGQAQLPKPSAIAMSAVPAQVLNDLGSYLFELRKYDRAEPFLAAAAASPTNSTADGWLVLARCRLFLKDYTGAKTASENYLETKPVLPAAKAQGLLVHGWLPSGAASGSRSVPR